MAMVSTLNEDNFGNFSYLSMKPTHRRRYFSRRRASLGAIYKDYDEQNNQQDIGF